MYSLSENIYICLPLINASDIIISMNKTETFMKLMFKYKYQFQLVDQNDTGF